MLLLKYFDASYSSVGDKVEKLTMNVDDLMTMRKDVMDSLNRFESV